MSNIESTIRSKTETNNKIKKEKGTITSNNIYVPPDSLTNHNFLNRKNDRHIIIHKSNVIIRSRI